MEKIHWVAAVTFSLIYIILAVQMTSAGHGTIIFLAPLTPLGLPWLLLIAAIVALGYIRRMETGYVFVALMVSHYVLTSAMLIYMWNDTLPATARMSRLHPLWMAGTSFAYVLPQVYAWARFTQILREPK